MSADGGKLRTASGGRVDRGRVLNFTFDGRHYSGVQGDTLASALLANGVHLVGRSFKYHRPRGIFSAGAEEPNALVGVRRDAARYVPNLRATQIELYEGLQAESQNRWPSLDFDVGAVNDLISPFIPAGFYYKTFMWPQSAWHSILRAEDSRHRGPRRGSFRARSGSLHQPLRSLRCVGSGCGSGRTRRGAGRGSIGRARHSVRRAVRAGRQSAVGAAVGRRDHRWLSLPRLDSASGRATRAHAGSNTAATDDRIRILPAQSRRFERAADRPFEPRARASAARANLAGPREGSHPRDRGHRASSRIPGQRPPRRHVSQRCTNLRKSLRGSAGHDCRCGGRSR